MSSMNQTQWKRKQHKTKEDIKLGQETGDLGTYGKGKENNTNKVHCLHVYDTQRIYFLILLKKGKEMAKASNVQSEEWKSEWSVFPGADHEVNVT